MTGSIFVLGSTGKDQLLDEPIRRRNINPSGQAWATQPGGRYNNCVKEIWDCAGFLMEETLVDKALGASNSQR